MAEVFLVVDTAGDGVVAGEILRDAWKRVDVVTSEDDACTYVSSLNHDDDLVVVVAAALVEGRTELSRVLRSRPRTEVIVAGEAHVDTQVGDIFVAKPYEREALLDRSEAAIARRRMNRVLPYLVSIQISEGDALSIAAAGTGCLVKLPKRSVILTAAHVVNRMRRAGSRTQIGGNGPPVDISDWAVLACDARVDIACVEIPATFDPRTIRSRLYVPEEWPPSRAQAGNGVLMVGFPSEHRTRVGAGSYISHGALFCDFVSSSSDRHFVVAPEHLDRKLESMVAMLRDIDDTGGMSGCPMFVGGHRERPQLRGILKEGSNGHNAVFLGAHVDFIRADGTLDEALIQ